MGNVFMWDTITLDGTVTPIRNGDYHPSYPISFLKDIWVDYSYRSKYGNNSGWGSWYIDDNNKYINFKENGTELTAVVTPGWYDASSLIAEVEAALETESAAHGGGYYYTVSYSDNANKFNIKNESVVFSLLWATGANASASIGADLGFDTSSDDTGSDNYTSDYVRIHNCAGFEIASGDGSAIAMKGCVLLGLNLTASYQTLELYRYTSSWQKVGDFIYDSDKGRAHLFFSEVSGSKWKVKIKDWMNPDGYVEVGFPLLGTYIETSRGYEYGEVVKYEDQSEQRRTKKGYLNISRGYVLTLRGVDYIVLDDDLDKLKQVYDAVGGHYPFIFVEDFSDVKKTMQYCFFASGFNKQRQDAYFTRVSLSWFIEG